MPHAPMHAHPADPASRRLSRATASLTVLLVFTLPALISLIPSASSDPVDADNPDDTHTLTWGFDEAADYVAANVSVGGGTATLLHLNESDGDDLKADFDLGSKTNVETSTVPGSVVLDSTVTGRYSVTLQPGPEGVDAYIQQDRPNDKYGTAVELRLDSETSKSMRILLVFDISSLPANAYVEDAVLRLYEISAGKGNPVPFGVHSLNRSFVENDVTWNRYDSTSMWTTPGGDFSTWEYSRGTWDNGVGWHSVDVSKIVEGWIRGSLANNGMILVPDTAGGDSVKIFQSSDETGAPLYAPKLTVNYTLQGGIGVFESRAIGPGTNATFTLASWANGTRSDITDEFIGSSLSSKWTWLNDPTAVGGSYNVGITRSGWLHVAGGTNTVNLDTDLGSNYLYQSVTGDFVATTFLDDSFTANSMGAGMLLVESPYEWLSIAKTDPGTSGRLQVYACEDGRSSQVANIAWSNVSQAYLRVERDSSVVRFYAGEDGTGSALIYTHATGEGYMQTLDVGVFVYSQSMTVPVVDFDYVRVEPLTAPEFELMVRVGNSTSFTDPSWEPWGSALPGQEAFVGETGRYLQYRAYFGTDVQWLSSRLDSFECSWERHATRGTIETYDYEPVDFSMWLTLTTFEDDSKGTVAYYYSTDEGTTWTYAGFGGSYSISSTEPAFRVRAVIDNFDTLYSPSIDSLVVMYTTALSSFLVVAPSAVVAGEPFGLSVYAKDGSNDTMIHWIGPLALTAMDASGASYASANLAVQIAQITTGGYATVPNERYYVAEVITIRAYATDAEGLSQQITVLPGPVSFITITPEDVDTVVEENSQEFTATAYDAYGNLVPGAVFSWTVEGGIGSLDEDDHATVTFTAGTLAADGWLNVTSGVVTASKTISVTAPANAPKFDSPIPDQERPEDFGSWSINLGPYVSDDAHTDSELRWYTTNESVVSVSGENRTGQMTLTLSTKPDQSGTNVLRVVVVDPDGMSGESSLTVVIDPVNDAPTIAPIVPLVVHFDDPYTYNFRYYVADVDDDLDSLVLSVDPESGAYANIDKLRITFTYPEALNGTIQKVLVTVSDGELSGSTVVSITVSDDTVPQISDNLPDVTMYQGDKLLDAFDLDDYFLDPDDEMLYYASGFDHVGVNITSDHVVSLFAPMDWSGDEYVVFSAIDPWGARVEDAIVVTVIPVNQPPWIADVPDLVVRYDYPYEFDLTRYLGDPDDEIDSLAIGTDDVHVAVMGVVLSFNYPPELNGSDLDVNITVSDGELSDWWIINVTVSDDYPPEALALADHSFREDVPMSYPVIGGLEDLFVDQDGQVMTFEAYMWGDSVTAETASDGLGSWTVDFTTAPNWYGTDKLTIRAVDSGGGLVESTIDLTVVSVADAPVLHFDTNYTVTVGVQSAYDFQSCVFDPDSRMADMTFEVPGEYAEYVDAMAGMLVMQFPEGFLSEGELSRVIEVEVVVTDQDGLHDSDTFTVTVTSTYVAPGGSSPWLWAAFVAMGGLAFGLFVIAVRRRKKPFVVTDVMLVHNDGFLIGRHAAPTKGEIDQDILSGMLTAVLNFVEDSMAASEDALKSFGFGQYKVLVRRGERAFMAVVHEGDAPEGMDKDMGGFLEKVDKIYRKSLASWSGDIESEFAGVDLLLGSWVKEYSKGRNRKSRSVFGLKGGPATK